MYRKTINLFFLALVFTTVGFLLGHFYFKEYRSVQKKMFWSAQGYNFPPDKVDNSLLLLGDMFIGEPPPEQTDIQFPSNVDGLVLDKFITGEEALEYARKIHGKDAPIQRVFISHYCSNQEQVILWLFEFSSSAEAKKHMEKVNNRIEKSHIFTECGFFYLQNVEINYVHGLKQNNYCYNKQNIIYWVSLLNEDPIPLFLQFYQYF